MSPTIYLIELTSIGCKYINDCASIYSWLIPKLEDTTALQTTLTADYNGERLKNNSVASSDDNV